MPRLATQPIGWVASKVSLHTRRPPGIPTTPTSVTGGSMIEVTLPLPSSATPTRASPLSTRFLPHNPPWSDTRRISARIGDSISDVVGTMAQADCGPSWTRPFSETHATPSLDSAVARPLCLQPEATAIRLMQAATGAATAAAAGTGDAANVLAVLKLPLSPISAPVSVGPVDTTSSH